jgi:oligopeptidase B
VPISLVWKEPLVRNGQRPMYLQAYGSYGINFDPSFSSHYLSLLDRGFIVGIAHVRGGEEMGRRWYDDGKQKRKRNTFTDFIACAEYLVAHGYVTSDRLAISGGAPAGCSWAPSPTFAPICCRRGGRRPLRGRGQHHARSDSAAHRHRYDEWGNPTADESAYRHILSYSPYDNVSAKAYPNLLVWRVSRPAGRL